MSDNPYSSPFENAESSFSKELPTAELEIARPLHDVAGWLKFLGVMGIVLGVFYCITIVGLIIGWVPIWMGVLLTGASTALKDGFLRHDAGLVRQALEKLATVTRIMGVLTILWLSVVALYFGIIIVAIVAGIASSSM